ncbi:hypothetical protein F7725_021250 [Dissostichus mawsoni]|uniref:Uncharacterized protein n=1 Tax=Dissostichus mawsoni TaxID=36200 RepID=A0A7J5YFH9_DISMA|nr:hypothetical protein F7725_021250 [Dissostichus mawsoni]
MEVPVLRTSLPRSFSAPYPPLEGIAEEAWQWHAWQEYQVSEEEYQRAVRVEGYILSLVQRYTLKSRHCWPRTTLTPDPQYYTSLRKRTPSFSSKQRFPDPHLLPHVDLSQSQGWGCDLLQGKRLHLWRRTAIWLCPTPSPDHSPWPRDYHHLCPLCTPTVVLGLVTLIHHYSHPHKHSSVGAQFIPGQAGQVSPRHSEQHSKGRTSKKSHNERPKPKKSSSKTSRSQSENSLLGQRLLPERRYSTTERHQGKTDQNTRVPGPQGGVGNESRRWCSNLELSQDEGEEAAAGIRRALRKARHCSHSQQQDFQQRAPLCRGEEGYNGPAESESSMSEVYSPASSSLSSDSDDFGGLVWPQQLPPRLASSSSSSSPLPKTTATANVNVQPKAFVKIKASHALKKKILRFRSGSLKVMTTLGTVRGVTRGQQHHEIHDVQRQPAQEEAQHHHNDDPQRPLGPGPTPRDPALRPAVNHQVTGHDHQEGEQESNQEAVGDDKPGAEVRVHRDALSLLLTRLDLLGVDKLGDAADQRQNPHSHTAQSSLFGTPFVLTPHGPADQHPAVHTDQNQLQDAAVHHQVKQAFHQRAGQGSEVPVVVVGQRHHEQRQREAAQEVRQRQVEEPEGGDGVRHAEARHPDHHSVPGDPQQDHQAVENQRRDLDGLHLRRRESENTGTKQPQNTVLHHQPPTPPPDAPQPSGAPDLCSKFLFFQAKVEAIHQQLLATGPPPLPAPQPPGAFGVVVGDAHPGRRLLADEVQHVAQRAVHAVFEPPTQTHVEQRVEAAVEVSQAQRKHLRQVQLGTVRGVTRGQQHHEVHDVQRQPAQEEAQHHHNDDPQRPLGPGPTPRDPALRPAVNHQVTGHDHQEGEQESNQEAVGDDKPGAEVRVHRDALSLLLTRLDLLGVDKLGDAADQRQNPHSHTAQSSLFGTPFVLTPHGPADQHPAVHTDQNQLQDAAVHHQVKQAFHQRAGQGSEVPVVVVGQRHHEQRQREAAQEVRQRQVEEPEGGDGVRHAEARHPDHHSVPGDPQQDHQAVENQRRDLDGLHLRRQRVREHGQCVVKLI